MQEQNKKLKFGYKMVLSNMPLLLFLAFLFLLQIANVHSGEKKIRTINKLGKQNKELMYQFKTLNGKLMFQSKKSELERAVSPMGLALPNELPILISDSTKVVR